MKSLYLIINCASFIVPFIFSFHPKLAFYKHWKSAWLAILISALIFVLWDVLYTYLGVWGFNSKYVLGIYFFNLPIEEVLFFFCIPYSCLFTIHCLDLLIRKESLVYSEKTATLLLLTGLFCIGLFNMGCLYTTASVSGLLALILWLKFGLQVNWLGRFYFYYLMLLIPFFIVNGILTGTGLDEAVVWYNNFENMGIRVLTIPLEDFIYGMLLILLNSAIYKYMEFRNKRVASAK